MFWHIFEMIFDKSFALVYFYINIHKYFVSAGPELEKKLKRENSVIKISSGLMILAAFKTEYGVPADDIHKVSHCETSV